MLQEVDFLDKLLGKDSPEEAVLKLRFTLEQGKWEGTTRRFGPWTLPLQPNQLAKLLHKYFISVQNSEAHSFFGNEGANFPNAEHLSDLLVRLNSIAWLSPTKELSENWLRQRIEEVCIRFQIPRKRLWLINDKFDFLSQTFEDSEIPIWNAAIDEAANILTAVAAKYRRTPAVDILFSAIKNVLGLPLEHAAYKTFANVDRGQHKESLAIAERVRSGELDRESARQELRLKGFIKGASEASIQAFTANTIEVAQLAMAWIVVEDLIRPRENPFTPLVDILETGAWPFSPVNDRFVVLVPS